MSESTESAEFRRRSLLQLLLQLLDVVGVLEAEAAPGKTCYAGALPSHHVAARARRLPRPPPRGAIRRVAAPGPFSWSEPWKAGAF